MTKLIRHKYTT